MKIDGNPGIFEIRFDIAWCTTNHLDLGSILRRLRIENPPYEAISVRISGAESRVSSAYSLEWNIVAR